MEPTEKATDEERDLTETEREQRRAAGRASAEARRRKKEEEEAELAALENMPYVAPPSGASEEYAAMFHVANNDAKWDTTYNQKRLRAFMESKPDKFNEQLTSLGKEHRMGSKKEGGAVVTGGEGTELSLKLVEDLLKKFPK